MKARPEISRNLHLELLETRTLLAGDLADPFGLVADLNQAMQALVGSGEFHSSFSTPFGNHRLVLTGDTTTALTINLDQLPAYITSFEVTSFGSVTLTGTDHVDNLILRNVGSFSAAGLSVEHSVVSTNVGSLSLESVNDTLWATGSEMSLSVDSLGVTAVIISEVKTLTLSSESNQIYITASPLVPDQKLYLASVPNSGFLDARGFKSIQIGLPPVDPGTSNPGSETPGSNDPGSGDPGTVDSGSGGGTDGGGVVVTPSDPDSGGFVIITRPLDAQTRTYLEQLSQLLHSARPGSDQQLLDLLNHSSLSERAINSAATELRDSWIAPVLPTAKYDPLISPREALLPISSSSTGLNPTASLPDGTWGEQNVFSDSRPIDEVALAPLPDAIGIQNLTDVQLSWPISLPPLEPHAATTRKGESGEGDATPLTDSVQALGTYIVQRVVAEFSPGQQSLVLLVDPQPTRNPAATKKTPVSAPLTALSVPATVTEI